MIDQSARLIAHKMRTDPNIMSAIDTTAVREHFAECLECPGIMASVRATAIMSVVLQEHYRAETEKSLNQAQEALSQFK